MQHILLELAIVVGSARLAGAVSRKLGLASVIGEILVGVLLANLHFAWPGFALGRQLAGSEFLKHLAEIGIVLMLFSVALESSLAHVARIGGRAFLVALVGVLAPFALAMGAARLGAFDPGVSPQSGSSLALAIFVGATLTATSVGITARVLQSAGALSSRTGQVILNAAVIDDILGLLVLAAVTSFASAGAVSFMDLIKIGAKAFAFFAVVIPLGIFVGPAVVRRARAPETLMAVGLMVCFGLAWLGMAAGLAPIVGGFFAGLALDDKEDRMRERIEPLVDFLSPIFFVLIGASIQLEALRGAGLEFAFATVVLFALAVLGKLACGLVAGAGVDRVAVGIGMVPRGEVGLIFATSGKQMGVVPERLFVALVAVVLLSTVLPTLLLERRLRGVR